MGNCLRKLRKSSYDHIHVDHVAGDQTDTNKSNINDEHEATQQVHDPKFLDRQAWANSVDPDQTAPKEQSDQGLHCLQFTLHLLDALLLR